MVVPHQASEGQRRLSAPLFPCLPEELLDDPKLPRLQILNPRGHQIIGGFGLARPGGAAAPIPFLAVDFRDRSRLRRLGRITS